jgi:bla regulator protein BlaR1
MTAFIIRSVTCMAIFFGLYWLILRKEKMLVFIRFYLIFSILFSLAAPFISIPIKLDSDKVANELITALNFKPDLNFIMPGTAIIRKEQAPLI